MRSQIKILMMLLMIHLAIQSLLKMYQEKPYLVGSPILIKKWLTELIANMGVFMK